MYILSQIFVIIAMIFLGLSFYTNDKKKVLLFCILYCIFYALQYFILNAYTGAIITVISILRNILFYINNKKKKNNINIDLITEGPIYRTDINDLNMQRFIKITNKYINNNVSIIKNTATSDGIYFSEKNINSAILNPIGANEHSDNEYVDMDSLVTLYNIYMEFLRGDEDEFN